MHHVVTIFNIEMLTLDDFKLSHTTLALKYHASMLTLPTSLISRALGYHKHGFREVRVYMH